MHSRLPQQKRLTCSTVVCLLSPVADMAPVLASRRQRYPLRRHVNVAVRQSSKAQDCVTKTIRDPFTIQFTHMPRGKIAHLAATFHHIDA
jgi:hypothetical protein